MTHRQCRSGGNLREEKVSKYFSLHYVYSLTLHSDVRARYFFFLTRTL